jgi:hypothetical protein
LQVQHKYVRLGKQNPHVKPPLDQLKAVVKDWPESFKMKDELIRVLEQMLSFQSVDRPTADQLQLLPLLGRCTFDSHSENKNTELHLQKKNYRFILCKVFLYLTTVQQCSAPPATVSKIAGSNC